MCVYWSLFRSVKNYITCVLNRLKDEKHIVSRERGFSTTEYKGKDHFASAYEQQIIYGDNYMSQLGEKIVLDKRLLYKYPNDYRRSNIKHHPKIITPINFSTN